MTERRRLPGIDTPARVAATCATGAACEAAIVVRFGFTPALGAYLCLGALATVVSATDLFARRVPNCAIAAGLLVGGLLLALASGLDGTWWALVRAGIAGFALGGFYLALGMAFPSGMGMGDVKWATVVGLYLGWLGWPAVATGTLAAFALGALGVLVLRLTSRGPPLTVPMAPFMAAGALLAVVLAR
ncbi:MAG: A24 family peptidase [Actinomycetota bacterium]|nr:A24 family peptidase [Actinomycetota bacterium]